MSLLHSGIATDPGTAHVTANIVMDSDTAIAEAERRDAQAVGLPAPVRATNDATERARTYRCETLSGMPLAPADALDFALAGYVRKFVFETETSDFTASERARLFKGAKRVGIMIRDRHCQGAGCSTHASYCEADHTIRHIDGGPTVPTNGSEPDAAHVTDTKLGSNRSASGPAAEPHLIPATRTTGLRRCFGTPLPQCGGRSAALDGVDAEDALG
ncbi:MAG: HNH endonuclease signature motif containing protein [Acidimicrobiales bacterium]